MSFNEEAYVAAVKDTLSQRAEEGTLKIHMKNIAQYSDDPHRVYMEPRSFGNAMTYALVNNIFDVATKILHDHPSIKRISTDVNDRRYSFVAVRGQTNHPPKPDDIHGYLVVNVSDPFDDTVLMSFNFKQQNKGV